MKKKTVFVWRELKHNWYLGRNKKNHWIKTVIVYLVLKKEPEVARGNYKNSVILEENLRRNLYFKKSAIQWAVFVFNFKSITYRRPLVEQQSSPPNLHQNLFRVFIILLFLWSTTGKNYFWLMRRVNEIRIYFIYVRELHQRLIYCNEIYPGNSNHNNLMWSWPIGLPKVDYGYDLYGMLTKFAVSSLTEKSCSSAVKPTTLELR